MTTSDLPFQRGYGHNLLPVPTGLSRCRCPLIRDTNSNGIVDLIVGDDLTFTVQLWAAQDQNRLILS